MTFKETISRYVVLKIDSGEWEPGRKLPTEHELGEKFGCSRLTARSALSALVSVGLINRRQGSGYFVSKDANNRSSKPVHKRVGSKITKTQKITDPSIKGNVIDAFGGFLEKYDISLDRTIPFEKRYFKNDKELSVWQFSWINKETLVTYDVEAINKSFTSYLAYSGIILSRIVEKLTFKDKGKFKKYAKQLGWVGKYPVKISILYDKERWIEFSVKIMDEDSFESVNSTEFSYFEE